MSSLAVMDPKDIPGELDRVGRSQADLARFLRLDPSSLSKTIKGTRELKARELRQIEMFLAGAIDGGEVEPISRHRDQGQTRIPVYGYAAAGVEDAVIFDSGRVIDWIAPPATFSHAGDLVAVRVLGESMEPRLFQGELVVAQLNVPPARDRDCLVELADGALVKTFVGIRDGHYHLRQYNPDKQITIPATRVRAMHAIVYRL